ncbi:MAG TPA: hypothetical protein DCR14_02860 [Acidimicrobiaceae bacterium]|nr:hypothetical protein [Acidimicrobiaceae bacterium]
MPLHHHDPATLKRRKVLSRTWAGMVVGWSLIRALIVWAAVGDYGLNPWVYLVIDLIAAGIDGYTTPRMVLAFIDDHYKQAVKWAAISLIVFIIPDLYIFFGTSELPKHVLIIICIIISATFLLAVWSVVMKIRKGRAAKAAGQCATADGSEAVPAPQT